MTDADKNGFVNFYITFKLTARNPTPPKQVVVINPTVAMPLKEAAHFKKVLKQLIAEVPLDFKNIRTGQWKSADKQEYDVRWPFF